MTPKRTSSKDDKFKTLFNSIGDAVFIHDLGGNFLEVNKVACQRLGYSRKELLKMSPMEIDAPEYSSKVKEKIKEIKKNGKAMLETAHVTKKGNHIPIELSSKLINYEGKKAILSVARNISEREKIRQELEFEKDRLRVIFEDSPTPIFIADVGTKKFTDCNKKAEELSGYSKKEILGMSVDDLHPQDALSEVRRNFKKQAKGEIRSFESKVVTKTGKEILVNISASTILKKGGGKKIVGSFQDITEIKKQQEQIEKEREKLDKILETVPTAIFTVDKNKKITSWNKKAEELTGYNKKEMIGKKCSRFALSPCNKKCGLWAKDVKKPITAKECSIKTKNGGERRILKNVDYFHDKEGGSPRGIESFIDVTEYQETKRELREKERKFKAIVDAARDAIVMLDSKGEVMLWNNSAEKMFGYKNKEAMGKKLQDLIAITKESKKKSILQFDKAKKGRTTSKSVEVPMKKKSGEVVIAALSISETKLDDRWLAVGIIRDITQDKEHERKLKEKMEEMEKMNKLMTDRELKMIELKEKIRELKNKSENK
jgi:PAS domain S-box-containing protein